MISQNNGQRLNDAGFVPMLSHVGKRPHVSRIVYRCSVRFRAGDGIARVQPDALDVSNLKASG
jgi:hypothetical protein